MTEMKKSMALFSGSVNPKFAEEIADKLGVPFVALVGEDEISEGVLSVKDMRSGEQIKLSPAQAAEFIRKAVEKRNESAVIKE